MKTARIVVALSVIAVGSIASADLEEIIVTAQKRPQSIDDVALSIAVVPGTYLQQRALRTMEDLTSELPSLTISKNSGAAKIYMRGIGSQGNAGLDQSVAMFIDDVYHGRSRTSKGALVDVDRVEIMRGAQATFFGRNASAGAVAIHTQVADLTATGGYVVATAGSDGEAAGTIAYNKALSNRFALRAVADRTSIDGYWDMFDPASGAKTATGGGVDSTVLRVASVWQPDDTLVIHLKVEAQDIERDNPFAWQPHGCGNLYGLGLGTQAQLDEFWTSTGSANTSPLTLPFSCRSGFADGVLDERSPADPFNDSDFEAGESVLTFDWHHAGATLTSVTGYFDMNYSFSGNDLSHGGPDKRTLWSQDDSWQLSEELRVTSNEGNALDWMIGAYWHKGSADYHLGDADGRMQSQPRYARSSAFQDEDVASVFAAMTWHSSKHLDASFGLRWTQTEKTFAGRDTLIRANILPQDERQAFNEQVLADASGEPASYVEFTSQIRNEFTGRHLSFSDLLPSFDLTYRSDGFGAAYYKWSRALKTGGFNFRLSGLNEEDLTYDSETVNAHEVGYKNVLLDGRLRLAVALFKSDYGDLQHNSSRGDDGAVAAAVIRNAAAATSKGVELDVSWQIVAALRLDLSAAWLDAHFDDYAGADCTRLQSVVSRTDVAADFAAQRSGNRCFQDLSGGRMPFAPRVASRVGLTHSQRLAKSLRLVTGLEWLYSDSFFTSPHADPLRRQNAFHKYNARIELSDRDARWELALIGANLSNELTARQLGQDGDAAVSGLIDLPRRYSVQASYRF